MRTPGTCPLTPHAASKISTHLNPPAREEPMGFQPLDPGGETWERQGRARVLICWETPARWAELTYVRDSMS
ncbi:hypothetical protein PCCS19_48210 [Paenibacillus sp. CCS19]|nr:hypothetical protein PCCS19_48210 [Paenibacillus cellulosilyticus]